jgi:hypothetical protein
MIDFLIKYQSFIGALPLAISAIAMVVYNELT